MQDNHPIGYFSRCLSDAEIRYTTTELECIAVVNAIDYFRIYLEGSKFTVITDHSALQWLLKFSNSKRRLFRWSKDLSVYNFDVIHRAGKHMQHVDALSRAPVDSLITTDCSQSKEISRQISDDYSPSNGFKKTERQVFCSSVSLLISSDDIIKAQPSASIQPHGRQFLKDGIICIKFRGIIRKVIPDSMVSDMLKTYHDEAGHPSRNKCVKQISQMFWWPKLHQNIRLYCKTCHICQLIKTPTHPTYEPLQPLPTPGKPMDLIAMNTMVMGTSAKSTKTK
jgi:hypothetical protein